MRHMSVRLAELGEAWEAEIPADEDPNGEGVPWGLTLLEMRCAASNRMGQVGLFFTWKSYGCFEDLNSL